METYDKEVMCETSTGPIKILVIYGSTDRKIADGYCNHLRSDVFENKDNISLEVCDISNPLYIDDAFRTCDFVLVLITKCLCEKEWLHFSENQCVKDWMTSKNRKCTIVPVLTIRELDRKFRIPMDLNAIKGLKFYNNDKYYKEAIRRLLTNRP